MAEKEDIPTRTEEPGTGQSNSENSSNVFVGPAIEVDFVTLQRDFYKQYGMHIEFS